VTLQYGQRRAFEPGTPLAVAVGQDVSQVDFALPRGSVITGRITDEFGEPVAGAFVVVQRYQYGPNGQRQLTFGGGTGLVVTNDLGEFRAYGLVPGEYIVSGSLRQATSARGSNPNDVTDGFVPTFYPGTTNAADAELVRVELAQETPIQIALLSGRLARVTGVVVDSMGRPVAGMRVAVRTSSGTGSVTMTNISTTGGDGSFLIANVSPGEHYLDVAGERRGDRPAEAASIPLTVATQDITNLRVVTGSPAMVSGTVVFEGDSPRRGVLSGLAIVARPADMTTGPLLLAFGEDGRVDETGRFQLQTMGNVFFRAINLGPWTLKQVTLAGEDITDAASALRLSETVQALRLVLTDRVTDVSGDVTNARGQAVKDFVVVIQPVREMEPIGLQRFLQTVRPDQGGRFRARALPPGEYIATAVESLEQGREWDPDYRPMLRDAGERFSIKEGESLKLSLKLAQGL
jgi:protocatechuate 3,4-dioxygenase beta subunit